MIVWCSWTVLVLADSCWFGYCVGFTTIFVRAIPLLPCGTLRTCLQRVRHEHVPALSMAQVPPEIQECETEVVLGFHLSCTHVEDMQEFSIA